MNETTGQKMASEVGALLRARNALIVVQTVEESRALRSLIAAGTNQTYEVRLWDCVAGVTDAAGKEVSRTNEPLILLNEISTSRQRAVWILKDLTPFLKDPYVTRALRNLAISLPSSPRVEARAIILLSPSGEVPPELTDHAVVVKWQLPDREEIAGVYDAMLAGQPPEIAEAVRSAGVREAAIEAAVGLSGEGAARGYAHSLVTQNKSIVPAVVAEAKRAAIQGKGLEWFEPDPRGLAAVGGLEPLKDWLTKRRAAFSQEARAFGLPTPKGIMLVGVPGCGKSLLAKAVSAAWSVPLLRLDIGASQSKWVGESQANIRAAFAVAEAVGNCVLWIDEIEKALAGATSGAADGGVSSDALGTLLSWMQERKGSVFVIATANDVTKLPPELLRKGRFDDLFFVDLPTRKEREEILRVTLKQFKRNPAGLISIEAVAAECRDFTGSEVAAVIPDALYEAFADGARELVTADLIKAARAVVPLAMTAADKIKTLRDWAKGRARPSSLSEESAGTNGARNLDLS